MGLPGAEPTATSPPPARARDVIVAPPAGAPTTTAGAAAEQPAPVFQPLSLQEQVVWCISRHLEVFERPRYRHMTIPVDLFLRVLRSASSHDRLHSGELMLRVTRNLPCLDCPEVDSEYWKPIVERTVGAGTCPIAEPYPALVARLRRSKQALEAWVTRRGGDQDGKKKNKDKALSKKPTAPAGTANEDVQTALRLLKELDRAPASTQLLADTRVGEAVAQVSKLEEGLAPANVISAAKALRKKWKALVQQEQAAAAIPKSGDKEEEKEEDDAMSPLAIGRQAARATTWRSVYKFSLAYDAHRRNVVGKRALTLAQGEEAGRHRTKEVAAWTGEDEERERRRKEKRPPPGNTERIRKMLKVRPPIKAPERPFGGLVMQPGKKKKLKVVG